MPQPVGTVMEDRLNNWKKAEDVVASLDEVSVFSKGQPQVAEMEIYSERHEKRQRERREEKKRMLKQQLQEKERQERENDRLVADLLLDLDLKNQNLSNSLPQPRFVGRGRGQILNDMKRRLEGKSARVTDFNEIYITEKVRKSTGYYGNDMIEKFWNGMTTSCDRVEESTSTNKDSSSACSSSDERLSPAIVESQFDEASSTKSDRELVVQTRGSDKDLPIITSQASSTKSDRELVVQTRGSDKELPIIASQASPQKRSPKCRNALINTLHRNLNLPSETSLPETTVCEDSIQQPVSNVCEESFPPTSSHENLTVYGVS